MTLNIKGCFEVLLEKKMKSEFLKEFQSDAISFIQSSEKYF